MKGCHGWLTLALCLLAAGGCRSQSASTAALERELRYQEDMIYQLQDYVETYKLYLDECRRENVACRDGKSPLPEQPGLPQIELNSPNQDSGTDQSPHQPPEVQLESRLQNQQDEPAVRALYRDSILRRESDVIQASYEPTDLVVTSMALDPEQTGGFQEDGQPGSEGILVGLQPRNADDEIVPAAGEIAVAVLDLSVTDPNQARVARWKFSAEQVALISADTPTGESTLLELPWPRAVPQSQNLQVYVRLVTPEATRLVDDQQIDLSANQLFVKSDPDEVEMIDESQTQSVDGWKARTRQLPLPPVRRTAKSSDSIKTPAKKRRPPKWQPYR